MTRPPRLRLVFLLAFALGIVGVLVAAAWDQAQRRRPAAADTAPLAEVKELVPGVLVAGQIGARDVEILPGRGVRAIVVLRPDGEEAGQPSSAELAAFAKARGLAFAYVPVPQGDLPDEVADALGRVLAATEGPVLLTCRSGRRAARAWTLAEASRPGGLSPEKIASSAQGVGQPVEDLGSRIAQRTRARAALN